MITEVVEQIEQIVKDVMNNSLHTAMPGKIVALNEASGLMDVQPIGSFYCGKVEMDYPVVPGIPMCIAANSKGIAACGPIKVGDDVLLVCSEQSLSSFLTGTSEAQSNEKFELTNCVAIPGIQHSMPNAQKEANEEDGYVITNGDDVKILITKEKIEIKNGEDTKILITKESVDISKGKVDFLLSDKDISLKGDVSIEGKVAIKGNLEVDGNIKATGTISGGGMEEQ